MKRQYMRTRQLQPGMKLDHPVVDRLGRNLVARGAELDQYMIDSMIQLGIMTVYVQLWEEDAANETKEKISPKAEKNIEKYRTDDRSKVMLSDSVKQRVSEGIQYIYSNTGSQEMVSATDSIANDLMSAINDNDAIAIDISALKTSDEYTFKHSVDVATIAMIIAKHQGLSGKEIHEIGMTGLLHDIGKTKIPLEVLNKPGRLDDDEFAIMKTHTTIGSTMLKSIPAYQDEPLMKMAHNICRWHHERYNGKGYPDGLKGDEIPISAQIVAMADVYDALTSERVYKKAFTHEVAVQMILDGQCGAFNPLLLECLSGTADTIQKELQNSTPNYANKKAMKNIVKEVLDK